jgi:hypothetical protein
MSKRKMPFEQLQLVLTRLARVIGKASNAKDLRALLLADTAAPYHSYDVLLLVNRLQDIGSDLVDLVTADLDEDGAPL